MRATANQLRLIAAPVVINKAVSADVRAEQ
jgi:hypothetical protein